MITKVSVENFKRFENKTDFSLLPDGITFLAGGNNSGKSSLLQALAIWEFCRVIVEQQKTRASLLASANPVKVGVTAEEFSPVAIPDLRHLWHNLKPTRPFRIGCTWDSQEDNQPISLTFALSLKNDSLFVTPESSTVVGAAKIPHVAYLPSFAGITAKEPYLRQAERNRLVGRGIAGAVLRNVLYEMWEENREEYKNLHDSRGRIAPKELSEFRARNSWEQLSFVLGQLFDVSLSVSEFHELYQTTLQVGLRPAKLKKIYRPVAGTAPRDIMTEGTGFLQWLSVYALAVDESIDVLLLDEPDAHLHPQFQSYLVSKLNQIANESTRKKQVMLATHSTTILSDQSLNRIYQLEKKNYLGDDTERVALFLGLGSHYSPQIEPLRKKKCLLFIEGSTDSKVLRILAKKLSIPWRDDKLEVWENKDTVDSQLVLAKVLKTAVPHIKIISLRDRDDFPITAVKEDLSFGTKATPLIKLRRWKRRNIENYLLVPSAIARALNVDVADINSIIADHSIVVPANYLDHSCNEAFAMADGKKILLSDPNSIGNRYQIPRTDIHALIAEAMEPSEIADDIKTLLNEIQSMCV